MAGMAEPDSVYLPSQDPLFYCIGRVAYAWSNLESELGRVLVAVLSAPLAAVLTTGQNYSIIHGHLEALVKFGTGKYKHESPPPLEEDHRMRLEAELVVVQALSIRRNQIVHGLWLPQPGSTGEHWYNLRPQRHRQMMPLDPITIPEMHTVAEEIDASAHRLGLIGENINHEAYGRLYARPFED
jgi:hypothetical protein